MDYAVSGVGVLDKAMHVLHVVEHRQPLSFLELSETVSFPKTTTHRLVVALEAHGFLRRDPDGNLTTGSRLATVNLSRIAGPILRQLSEDTGESSQLFVRRGQQRLALVAIESREELRTTVPVGALLTLERGSSGRLLRGDEQALRKGWVESVGERVAGIASVSAAVRENGDVVAAVCLSGPVERLGSSPGRRYAKFVVAAAKEIELALATASH